MKVKNMAKANFIYTVVRESLLKTLNDLSILFVTVPINPRPKITINGMQIPFPTKNGYQVIQAAINAVNEELQKVEDDLFMMGLNFERETIMTFLLKEQNEKEKVYYHKPTNKTYIYLISEDEWYVEDAQNKNFKKLNVGEDYD